MVGPEAETMSSQGEAESSPAAVGRQRSKRGNSPLSELGRQSSIYSLTLDEFQHTLCEDGKNFGSMNMDEFLSSIWTAEESHHHHHHHQMPLADFLAPARQNSLPRQGSLALPAPLCRKTVEEVWSEIHGKAAAPPEQSGNNGGVGSVGGARGGGAAPRQPTFGEMTLEDFLVKAGVVREQAGASVPPQPQPQRQPHQQQQQYGVYGVYSGSGGGVGHGFVGGSGAFAANRGGGGGGYGVGPGSPASSDGVCGIDVAAAMRGRKRIVDGPVVERRQRRMIKNRESAARSRARKQAYTVELEAELNQLREENTHLKQALAELERKQKQQYVEEMKMKVQTRAFKAKEKLRVFRRISSCHL